MKIKKVHLAGVIGLLLIAGLVLSPVVNVAAIGTFTDENGRIVHPVVNPDSKPFGENQSLVNGWYNGDDIIVDLTPISDWYDGIVTFNDDIIIDLTPIADLLKWNQYPMWIIKHYSNR